MHNKKYNYKILLENWESPESTLPTRDAYGDALVDLATDNKDIVALNANLEGSVRQSVFAKRFPERYFQVGVAEQNLASIATGLALYGKIPFMSSFASFSPGLNYSQIRLAAISKANIKIASTHYGVNIGADGGTAQMLSDVSMMRALPGMVIITPADYNQAYLATKSVAKYTGPVYIRFTRSKFPVFLQKNTSFRIGENQVLRYGNDISLFTTGSLVYRTLKVAKRLELEGIDAEVVNVHTIKPIDKNQIIESVGKTCLAVSIEEHNIYGGLGSAIAEVLSQYQVAPLKIIGVNDEFGESGTKEELLASKGLSEESIYLKIKNFIKKKYDR